MNPHSPGFAGSSANTEAGKDNQYYRIRAKITECWLAETEGIFFLITRALLVIKRAWLLDADWLSTPALSWLPASNGFQKRIASEFDLYTVISS